LRVPGGDECIGSLNDACEEQRYCQDCEYKRAFHATHLFLRLHKRISPDRPIDTTTIREKFQG